MFFHNPKEVLGSSVFRITVGCLAALMLLVAMVAAVVAEMAIRRASSEAREELSTLSEDLYATLASEGAAGLKRHRFGVGAAPEEDRNFFSLRRDEDGALLAGFEIPIGPGVEPFLFTPPGWDEDEPALLQTSPTGDGALLTVGVSLDDAYDVEEALTFGFAAMLIIGAPLTLITGYVLSALVLHRLEPLADGAVRLGAGQLEHRIATSLRRDEFDELCREFNQMAASLQNSYEALKDLSAGIAHNLKTPLTRLQQRLFTATATLAMDLKGLSEVEAARREADGLVSMFESLLRIAEIEAGQRRKAFRRISFSDLAEEAVESFGPVAEDLGGSFIATISGEIEVIGDAELLRQLLALLIENAIEHGGGHVDIDVAEDDGACKLTVADQGPGVPRGERSWIFDRFYRAASASEVPGTGLGLSIARSIVELHGGEIRAEEAIWDGAAFVVTLPSLGRGNHTRMYRERASS